MAKTITWSVEAGGHMYGITHQQQLAEMNRAFWELEQVCDINMVRKTSGYANLRYVFKTNAQMTLSDGSIALGRGYDNGLVKILKDERPGLDLNAPRHYRLVGALILHEAFHTKYIMNWDHSSNIDCIIHANLSSNYFCRREVELLQGRFGEPTKVFSPVNRDIALNKFWGYYQTYTTHYNTYLDMVSARDQFDYTVQQQQYFDYVAARDQFDYTTHYNQWLYYHNLAVAKWDEVVNLWNYWIYYHNLAVESYEKMTDPALYDPMMEHHTEAVRLDRYWKGVPKAYIYGW